MGERGYLVALTWERRRPRRPPIWMHHFLWLRAATNDLNIVANLSHPARVTQRLCRHVILGTPAPSPAPNLDAPLPVDTCRDQRTKP